MTLKLASENDLKKIAYVRVLEFAANEACDLGFTQTKKTGGWGFSLPEVLDDSQMKDIDVAWLKELLPSICTVRGADGEEIKNLTGDLSDEHRFVIKSDEFIKYVTLRELEDMGGALKTSRDLLSKAQENLVAANDLLAEAKKSGKTANFALSAAALAVLVAIAVPPIVVKLMTSTVAVTDVSLDDEKVNELVGRIERARISK